LPDCATGGEHIGTRFQPEAAELARTFARLHGLGPRLQDVELFVDAIPAPFDIHGSSVMLLDGDGMAGELMRFGVADREPATVSFVDVDGRGRVSRLPAAAEDHPQRLRAQSLAQDGRSPCGEVGLVKVELVGIHGALHYRLAKPVRRGDQHDLVETGFGVEREHHTRCAEIASDHRWMPADSATSA
jgi:hypothetical protein